MFAEVFRFELRYQLRRYWTWLGFIAVFGIVFLTAEGAPVDDATFTNTFINSYRSKKRRPDETELDEVEDLYLYRRLGGLEAVSAGRSAEDELMDWFTDAEVKDAIEGLPENFRLAVLLADVEGFSYKEIAEILDIPIGTVMSRLHRGRKALQKALVDVGTQRGLVGNRDG